MYSDDLSCIENSKIPTLFFGHQQILPCRHLCEVCRYQVVPTFVSFRDAESRKLCKKMKVDLSAKDKKVELFHYQ